MKEYFTNKNKKVILEQYLMDNLKHLILDDVTLSIVGVDIHTIYNNTFDHLQLFVTYKNNMTQLKKTITVKLHGNILSTIPNRWGIVDTKDITTDRIDELLKLFPQFIRDNKLNELIS
jgi:hypothetical protein